MTAFPLPIHINNILCRQSLTQGFQSFNLNSNLVFLETFRRYFSIKIYFLSSVRISKRLLFIELNSKSFKLKFCSLFWQIIENIYLILF